MLSSLFLREAGDHWHCTPPLLDQLCAMATPSESPMKSMTRGLSYKKKSMTQGRLYKKIAEGTDLSLKEVRDVFSALKIIVFQELKSTKQFEIPSLVTVSLKHRPARNARVKMILGKEVMVKAQPAQDFIKCACLLEPSQTMSEAWTAGGEGLQGGARREVVDAAAGVARISPTAGGCGVAGPRMELLMQGGPGVRKTKGALMHLLFQDFVKHT